MKPKWSSLTELQMINDRIKGGRFEFNESSIKFIDNLFGIEDFLNSIY